MSIGTFVSLSLELLKEGKYYDVALALACSAVDATSAKCFPHENKNNVRYKSFLKQNMRIVTARDKRFRHQNKMYKHPWIDNRYRRHGRS